MHMRFKLFRIPLKYEAVLNKILYTITRNLLNIRLRDPSHLYNPMCQNLILIRLYIIRILMRFFNHISFKMVLTAIHLKHSTFSKTNYNNTSTNFYESGSSARLCWYNSMLAKDFVKALYWYKFMLTRS